jgi:hypothetical protein
MDASTSLVEAYLHVNGYFTATDYPLVESVRGNSPRMLTDIDMLAVRFGRPVNTHADRGQVADNAKGPVSLRTDPALGCPDERTDMIVAEVKQGRVQINTGSRNRHALAAALARFGCCGAMESSSLVKSLLQNGRAQGKNNHVVRMVVFASHGDHAPRGWHWVHLDHVFLYLERYLRQESDILGVVDLHDPALGWLTLLHKCNLRLNQKDPMS